MSTVDLSELAAQVTGTMPRLDRDGIPLALMTYRRLAEGASVRVDALACAVGLSESRAREVLLDACEVMMDEAGAIVGFGGLALAETAHRFEVDGVRLYTWCAWDALFLPPLLGKSAYVSSTCPVTGQVVNLVVSPGGIVSTDPRPAVMSFLAPTCSRQDIVTGFCHYVLLFASAQAGEQWTAKHPWTFLLSIEDAFELGGLVNAARYGPFSATTGLAQ
ncbi:MAG: organomercurial lyase [Egibacteraceae bacterium]